MVSASAKEEEICDVCVSRHDSDVVDRICLGCLCEDGEIGIPLKGLLGDLLTLQEYKYVLSKRPVKIVRQQIAVKYLAPLVKRHGERFSMERLPRRKNLATFEAREAEQSNAE